jgi:hypothetical protein
MAAFHTSIATTQLSQQPPVAFIRAVVGSGRESCGNFHTRSELLTTPLARECFVIESCRLTRWATASRYRGHNAFEQNGGAGEGDGIAGFDPVRGFHTLAIEMDFAAADRIGCGGTGLEQADGEQPAVDSHGARPSLFRCIHGRPSSDFQFFEPCQPFQLAEKYSNSVAKPRDMNFKTLAVPVTP